MRPNFLDPLQLEAVPPSTWKLLASFTYRTIVRGKFELITAEKDFENDLASIPRFLRWLIPVNGRHRWPAVIHDKGYSVKGVFSSSLIFTRLELDDVFNEGMKVMGVPLWKRVMLYRGVRAGGWVRWNK